VKVVLYVESLNINLCNFLRNSFLYGDDVYLVCIIQNLMSFEEYRVLHVILEDE